MSIAIAPAIRKLMKHHALDRGDVDLWELHEAYAVTTLYNQAQLETPWEITNVNGGAVALGHPYGMSGIRYLGSTLLELGRRSKRTRGRRRLHGGRHGDRRVSSSASRRGGCRASTSRFISTGCATSSPYSASISEPSTWSWTMPSRFSTSGRSCASSSPYACSANAAITCETLRSNCGDATPRMIDREQQHADAAMILGVLDERLVAARRVEQRIEQLLLHLGVRLDHALELAEQAAAARGSAQSSARPSSSIRACCALISSIAFTSSPPLRVRPSRNAPNAGAVCRARRGRRCPGTGEIAT